MSKPHPHAHDSGVIAIHRGRPRRRRAPSPGCKIEQHSTTTMKIYSPPPFFRLVLVEIQKYDGIRRRQSHVRTHAPIQGQLPPGHRRPILGIFGARESDAAVGVSVADDIRPPRQRIDELGRRLPTVRAEQQVYGSIIRLDGGLEVFVDQSTD